VKAERLLVGLLVLEGGILTLALPAVFLPTRWMAAVWEATGLGPYPAGPLVEYLTRSLSMLYATWGPFHLFVACEVRRYLALLMFLGAFKVAFGAGMLALDLWVGMPWYWTAVEGPGIMAFGAAQYLLARRVGSEKS
jgi:hypothetical protein